MEIKCGCCGWTYLPKKFVKPGQSRLSAYAKIFNLVEVDSTFNNLPKASTAKAWRKEVDKVNPEFEFTVKAPKTLTHISKFKDLNSWEKIKAIALGLKAKIIFLQTPESFKSTEENIKALKDFISITENQFTFVMEARGWERSAIEKVFPELGIIQVVDPLKERPIEQEWNYYRLQGYGSNAYRYRFSDEELEKLTKIVKPGDYVLFNNVFMYEDCLRFRKLLGEEIEI